MTVEILVLYPTVHYVRIYNIRCISPFSERFACNAGQNEIL